MFLFGYFSCVQINFDSPVKFCQKLEKLHLKSEDETVTILPSIWQEHCVPKKKALCVWGKVFNIIWRLHKQVYSCLCHQRETNSFVTFRSCSGLHSENSAFMPQIQVMHFSSLSALPVPFSDSECSLCCFHVTTNNHIIKQIFNANTGHNN